MRDVADERLPAGRGQAVKRLRLARDKPLFNLDVAGVFELAQMDAGITVGCLDRGAHGGKLGDAGTGEKGDDRQPHPAVQHLVDRGVVEIGHGCRQRCRRRSSMRPGAASSSSISAADSGRTSA